MGKQINYYMDYESFLKVAQTALDEGCLILSTEHTPEMQVPCSDLSIISEEHLRYYFYLPELGELTHGKDNFGNYYVKYGFSDCALCMIEAGFSRKTEDAKGKSIVRNRLYVMTGYYRNGEWIARPERLEKVYNKLVRAAKKVAPRTGIEYDAVDLKDGRYGAPYKDIFKEYISAECMRWYEEGYEIPMLKHLKEQYATYLRETDYGRRKILKPQRILLDRLNPKNKYPTYQNKLAPRMEFGTAKLKALYERHGAEVLHTAYEESFRYLNDDQLCNDEENMFPRKSRLTGEYYVAGVTFADNDYCAVKLNFLGKQGEVKDDYLGLEIIYSYDQERDLFRAREVNSECI